MSFACLLKILWYDEYNPIMGKLMAMAVAGIAGLMIAILINIILLVTGVI